MDVRLGDILVDRGVLSAEQRDRVLEQQRISGRPFGLLSEEMFGVCPRDVEGAWASQYASRAEWIDAGEVEPCPEALNAIDARQAWQFGVVPVGMDEEGLVLATTEDRLARALRFAGWRVGQPSRFVMCDEEGLCDLVGRHYPMAGLSAAAFREMRLAGGA
jgi:hypothetical protein